MKQSPLQPVGEQIRLARVAKRLSLRGLAKSTGMSATYLSHVEVGLLPSPMPDKLTAIARELDLDLDSLLEVGNRWEEHAAAELTRRPKLKGLMKVALALNDDDIEKVIQSIRRDDQPEVNVRML
ncbi:MAG: helix-turn-helix domain-containing protein [Armatimonadetes bacterium]|nr:helix-turn-helix domain-containing protein [Armatimonadota bacterium]